LYGTGRCLPPGYRLRIVRSAPGYWKVGPFLIDQGEPIEATLAGNLIAS
jgi:hypothetical protein